MARMTTFPLGGSSKFGILLAGGLAALSGLLVFTAVRANSGSGTATAAAGADTTVVVAKQDIAARTTITVEMLETTTLPKNALPSGAFTDQKVVIGQVARIPIYKGEPMVQGKLVAQASKTDLGLSYIVPPGQRAMAISIDKVIGAGGLLRPGDRVDVLGVVSVASTTTTSSSSDKQVITVAQNIEVLAVEQALENQIPVSAEDQSAGRNVGTPVQQHDAQPAATVVTLALTPQQAQQLLLIDAQGKLRLTVRAPGDTAPLDTAGVVTVTSADLQAMIQDALKKR